VAVAILKFSFLLNYALFFFPLVVSPRSLKSSVLFPFGPRPGLGSTWCTVPAPPPFPQPFSPVPCSTGLVFWATLSLPEFDSVFLFHHSDWDPDTPAAKAARPALSFLPVLWSLLRLMGGDLPCIAWYPVSIVSTDFSLRGRSFRGSTLIFALCPYRWKAVPRFPAGLARCFFWPRFALPLVFGSKMAFPNPLTGGLFPFFFGAFHPQVLH